MAFMTNGHLSAVSGCDSAFLLYNDGGCRNVNLPNAITVGRIFLVPLLVVVLLTNPKDLGVFGISKEILGALIFAVASLSDWLDGYLARRRKQITELGQWMDPLADKLLVTSAFVSLVYLNLAPAWMVTVILGREFYVTVLRSIAHAKGQALPASPLGKVKMVAQVAAILILILGQGHLQDFFALGQVALWIATVSAIVSAFDYTRRINAIMGARPAAAPALTSPPPGTPADAAPAAAPAAVSRKRLSA
jgi:CDP-diacylglycerol--glycerol-3-phosphate 3-phosphatidyltransferase